MIPGALLTCTEFCRSGTMTMRTVETPTWWYCTGARLLLNVRASVSARKPCVCTVIWGGGLEAELGGNVARGPGLAAGPRAGTGEGGRARVERTTAVPAGAALLPRALPRVPTLRGRSPPAVHPPSLCDAARTQSPPKLLAARCSGEMRAGGASVAGANGLASRASRASRPASSACEEGGRGAPWREEGKGGKTVSSRHRRRQQRVRRDFRTSQNRCVLDFGVADGAELFAARGAAPMRAVLVGG
eukprot:357833-Chlamydomonas_euryale.AAC.8